VQETRSIRGRFKVEHERDTAQVWCGPFKQFEPFSAHIELETRKASHIAAWMRQACDELLAERVRDSYKDDWSSLRRPSQGGHSKKTACQNDFCPQAYQFYRIAIHLGGIGIRVAIFGES
jgi:hypothetical protein